MPFSAKSSLAHGGILVAVKTPGRVCAALSWRGPKSFPVIETENARTNFTREDHAPECAPKKGMCAGDQNKYVHREPHGHKLGVVNLTDEWGRRNIIPV